MKPFTVHRGIVAPLVQANIDTDQIIPKQFLKRIERTGFGQSLFYDWRFDASGQPKARFVLNRPPFDRASILVAGPNFGCGSSREHAIWALMDFGFRAVLAPSFADIFATNATKNGLLAATISEESVRQMERCAEIDPGFTAEIDLAAQLISTGFGWHAPFRIDPYRRRALLEGLDEIGATLNLESSIAGYEKRMPVWQ